MMLFFNECGITITTNFINQKYVLKKVRVDGLIVRYYHVHAGTTIIWRTYKDLSIIYLHIEEYNKTAGAACACCVRLSTSVSRRGPPVVVVRVCVCVCVCLYLILCLRRIQMSLAVSLHQYNIVVCINTYIINVYAVHYIRERSARTYQ